MKPDDRNGLLPTAQRPFRVLLISGSDRRQYNCPGVDSKSRTLSVGVRSIQVVLAGASPLVVLIYEIVLESSTEFHHSNLRLPKRIERDLTIFHLFVIPFR